jgi:NAD(P)-dependent dehydrogenase (short-subunit alcohol dehydrogenase family)
MPSHSVYEATKGAIAAWTRGLAVELAPLRIRVNAVAPGAIEVPRFYDRPGYSPEAMGARIPWGEVGHPLDIARACAYLASDEASYVTGATLVVDGGLTARLSLFT